MDSSSKIYKQVLLEKMKKQTGIDASKLEGCIGSNNHTVFQCPISQNLDKPEFIVVVHNPSSLEFNRFVKIRLPNKNYKA